MRMIFPLPPLLVAGATLGGLLAPFAVGGGPTDSIGIAAATERQLGADVAVCHRSASGRVTRVMLAKRGRALPVALAGSATAGDAGGRAGRNPAGRTPRSAPDQSQPARRSASNTLVANIQIVMPGEIARAHRHSAAALRLIIEGGGGYTVVNGERVPMYPGDLVLTPNWSWHDHANDTDAPMIWLDGLDTPLVRMLEAGFYEEYHQERQDFGAAVNASQWHYPMSEMRAALQRLAAANTGDAGEGIILEYTNRVTGGPVMPTIACHMQLLRPGEKTQARRRVCCTNYHVVEGAGYSMVGDQRLDWEDKDVFTVPTWTFCEHVNSGDRPAFLFSFSDAPVMKALSLYREETRA